MSDKLPPKILVVEPDDTARGIICNAIERYWFAVIRATNQEEAQRLLAVNHPHVAIIGSNSNEISILDTCMSLRSVPKCEDMPLVIILKTGETKETYRALNNDLIEFISRPYTSAEILRAIKALLRRSKPVFQDKIIRYKDLSMDLSTYKVYKKDRRIHIGPTEFKLLQLLVESPKVIFSRQQLMDYVWGTGNTIEYRTVDVHVNRIRSMIRESKKDLPFIKTVRSAGYCLNLPGEIG
ncbi:MAG: winged helix-turn-helix domain-containing protein [Pseudomonadota bacterium]